MPHLNKNLTVRLAAINAALAGCLPEYLPVVLAAWDAFLRDGMVTRSIWQSTTGHGAVLRALRAAAARRSGSTARGNVWGSGFRANATIGRAIRLGAINGLGLKPHVFDQATQGNPAKYSCFIAENEEDSPWPSLAADNGIAPGRQRGLRDRHPLGAAHRGQAHHRARAAGAGLRRLAVPHRRAGAGERGRVRRAQPRARPAVRQARLVQGRRPAGDRRAAAGAATGTSRRPARRPIAHGTGWRLPADHPDALPQEVPDDQDTPVQLITVRRRGADRGGRRAQRRRLLDRGDLRPVRPPARDRQGRGEVAHPFIRNVRGLLSGHRVLAGVEHPSRLPGEVGARRREDVDELVDAASHRL